MERDKVTAQDATVLDVDEKTVDVSGVKMYELFGSDGSVIGYTTALPLTGNFTVSSTPNVGTTVSSFARNPPEDAEPEPWEGPLAIVGHPTSDRRYLIPGEISNRELPLPFMVQTVTSEGHDGSEVAGRIEKIEQIPMSEFERADEFNLGSVPDEAIIVWGEGVFDGSPAAEEARRLLDNGSGVSIDIPTDRVVLIDPDTFEEIPDDQVDMEDVLSGKYLTGLAGKIAGATVVTIPAFEEATVQLVEGVALVAAAYGIKPTLAGALADRAWLESLLASGAPLRPPREWFDDQRLTKLTPLTIGEDGRIFGHLADWDGCHTGFANVCVPPFRSQTDYAYFNVGEMECADGSSVPVGKLMFNRKSSAGHAITDPGLSAEDVRKHYDDSTRIAGFVRAGEDRFGTWLAGVLRPGLSDEDLQIIKANPPSGDWRPIPGKSGSELVAAFCVPVPGFPIPRMMVASAGDGLAIITGPLVIEMGPRARKRKWKMLNDRLAELRAA